MVKEFQKLSSGERDLLYKAPALVSVLAACPHNDVNPARKKDAIKLAHLKTFTADPLLKPYYAEVEKGFEEQFETIARQYAPFDEEKRHRLQEEINRVNEVLARLNNDYARTLNRSLQGYANHVKRADHSVFQDFLFPLHIPGLND